MAKLKIQQNKLLKFLKKVRILKNAVLEVQENKLKVVGLDPVAKAYFLSYEQAIDGIEEEGSFYITGTANFMKLLGLFASTDELDIDDKDGMINLRRLVPRKVVTVAQGNDTSVATYKPGKVFAEKMVIEKDTAKTGKVQYTQIFETDVSVLQGVVSELSTFSTDRFEIRQEGGKVLCKTRSKVAQSDQELLVNEVKGEDGKSSPYSAILNEVLSELDGIITCYWESNAPLIIHQKDDKSELIFLASPVVGEAHGNK